MRIKITIGELAVFVRLNDSGTAKMIWDALPLQARAELWGEEVYFYITPKAGIEKTYAREEVEAGDAAYWPQGPCMCLFFGMTPNSRDNRIRPASAVNVIGRMEGDPRALAAVREGAPIRVEREG